MATKTANVDFDLFDQFDDEMQESGGLAYLQIISPGMKNAALLDKNPLAYGLCLPADQAEAVGLDVSRLGWAEGESIMIHPQSTAIIEKGYVGRGARMVVVSYSDLEVEQKNGKFWRYAGQASINYKTTELGAKAFDSDEKDYRVVRRFLVLLLDKDNQPLHEIPLQLKGRGVFGTTLGYGYLGSKEQPGFHDELGQAYHKAAKAAGRNVKGGKFTPTGQAYTIFEFGIGYQLPDDSDKAGSSCINRRWQPVFDRELVGKTAVVKQRDRELTLEAVYFGDVIVNQKSPLGELITSLRQEYASFPEPNRGRDTDAVSDGSAPFSGQGHFDASTLDGLPDGSIRVVFDDGTARHPLHIPANLADINSSDELVIDGIIPADGGPVQVTRVQVVEHAAPVSVGAVPAGVSF